MSKNRRGLTLSKTFQNWALGLLALIVVLLGIYSWQEEKSVLADAQVAQQKFAMEKAASDAEAKAEADLLEAKAKEDAKREGYGQEKREPKDGTLAPALFAPWNSSINLLKDPARPWSLAVLGDSTGNGPDEWVYLLAAELSEKHKRPVDIHNWILESNKYGTTTRVGSGSNAPITIWNSSASGQSAKYTLSHFDVAVPKKTDAVIISHGHNNALDASVDIANLTNRVRETWKEAPALAITLQNPRTDARDSQGRALASALRQKWGSRADVELIDVRAAFEAEPDIDILVSPADSLHPTPAGSRVWADAVLPSFS